MISKGANYWTYITLMLTDLLSLSKENASKKGSGSSG